MDRNSTDYNDNDDDWHSVDGEDAGSIISIISLEDDFWEGEVIIYLYSFNDPNNPFAGIINDYYC